MINLISDWAEKELVTIHEIHETEKQVIIFCYGVHFNDLNVLKYRVEGWHIAGIKPCDDELIEIQLYVDE